jgi:uncharacterized GH25 family protein
MNRPTGTLAILPLLLSMLSLPACAATLSGKPIEGQVLEQGSNKPIPDAIVIARWQGTVGNIATSSRVCYHVLSAVTDADGRYHFSAWKKDSTYGRIADQSVTFDAYKAGYEWADRDEKTNTVYVKPFGGQGASG